MALSFVASSAWVSGTASVTPGIPTGTAADDYVVICLVSKYEDASLGGAPAGWDDLGTAINATRTLGNDNGGLRGRLFGRVWQTGDVMPDLAPVPNNVSTVHATTYRVAAGKASEVEAAGCVDDVTGSPLLLAAGSTLGLTSGDVLHVDEVLNGDVVTWGTGTLTATGATMSALTVNTADLATALGTDLRMRSVRYTATAGAATGNAQLSTALAGTTTNAVGVGFLVRIREVTPSVAATGQGSGSWAYTGAAQGTAPAVPDAMGTAAGTWAYTGTASGSAPTIAPANGTATGTWAFAGVAQGVSTPTATGTGSWVYTGAAEGTTTRTATAAGTWEYIGASTGTSARAGTAGDTWSYAGTAEGAAPVMAVPTGEAGGAWSYTGTAQGSAPGVGTATGQATGAYSYTGAATGATTKAGSASGAWSYQGAASGTAPAAAGASGTAGGTWSYTGASSGATTKAGLAAGAYGWTGVAVGTTVYTGQSASSWEFTGVAVGANFSGYRDITLVIDALTGHPLAVTGPAGHPVTLGGLTGHRLTTTGPTGHRLDPAGPTGHPLTTTPVRS